MTGKLVGSRTSPRRYTPLPFAVEYAPTNNQGRRQGAFHWSKQWLRRGRSSWLDINAFSLTLLLF